MDTVTSTDTTGHATVQNVDKVAELLLDTGHAGSEADNEESVHKAYAPSGASYDDMLEGMSQAAQEINQRGNRAEMSDVEQSQYHPDDDNEVDTGINQVNQGRFPDKLDHPEKVVKAINWLQEEIGQLNYALENNIITPDQYEKGMAIAQGYANEIQGTIMQAQQREIESRQQAAQADEFIAQHIPSWQNPNQRQQTVKQIYNWLNSVGISNDMIASLPHTPEMAIFTYRLMKESQKARQIENKRLKHIQKQKALKQAAAPKEKKPFTRSIGDQTNAIASLLAGLGGA